MTSPREMMEEYLHYAGDHPSDLTDEEIAKNKVLVQERLDREAEDVRALLSGKKTLGSSYPTDEQLRTGDGLFIPREYV